MASARRAKRPLLDYPFIPKPLALLHDTRVSHLAYRLWDAIYDLQWRHVPPTMARLQAAILCDGQPATRRSVERWLTELEHTGWLEWRRRASLTERYQLKTGVTADDAEGSVQDRLQAILRTGVSVEDLRATLDAIVESHNTTPGSHNTIVGSHHATLGSDHATLRSHDLIPGSHATIIERSPDHDQTPTDPMPARLPRDGDDGDAPPSSRTETETWLRAQGVSEKRARQYRHFDLAAVRADLLSTIGDATGDERQRRIGRTLKRWEVAPPSAAPDSDTRLAQLNARYGDLFRAGGDTSDLDVAALDQHEAGRD